MINRIGMIDDPNHCNRIDNRSWSQWELIGCNGDLQPSVWRYFCCGSDGEQGFSPRLEAVALGGWGCSAKPYLSRVLPAVASLNAASALELASVLPLPPLKATFGRSSGSRNGASPLSTPVVFPHLVRTMGISVLRQSFSHGFRYSTV